MTRSRTRRPTTRFGVPMKTDDEMLAEHRDAELAKLRRDEARLVDKVETATTDDRREIFEEVLGEIRAEIAERVR